MSRSIAVKFLGVLTAIFVLSIALINLRRPSPVETNVVVPEVWFEDIKNPISLSASDSETLVQFVSESILHRKRVKEDIPVSLKSDVFPRIAFLSISDGVTSARVVLGSGKGIMEAVEEAMSQIRTPYQNNYRPKWIKLDIVQDVRSKDNVNFDEPVELQGLQGIAFDRRFGIAFLPEELSAYVPSDSDQKVKLNSVIKYLKKRSIHSGQFKRLEDSHNIKMYRFTTLSFFSDGKAVTPLYRGHRSVGPNSKEELLSAARLAGEYLTRSIDSEGKFAYLYEPKTDDVKREYNILRHAGTVYAMLELYEITGDEQLLQAVHRGIKYLLRSAKSCWIGRERATCISEWGYVKLGGNALAVIALAKYMEVTHDGQYMPVLLQLGRWIQNVQRENGEFFIHKQFYLTGRVTGFVSNYYPGEALLALLRIHALNLSLESQVKPTIVSPSLTIGTGPIKPHETWLDTAAKGAKYLINVRDRTNPTHDHWLLYALNELYRHRPDPLYLKHAYRIANAMIQSQHRRPIYPDWVGGYFEPPGSTPTAARTEGLCAAYMLARDFGSPRRAERILKAIRLGVAFQLQTQFRPESVLYLKEPKRALGGFHQSLTNFDIRIDYVQHNLSSILGLYRIIEDEEINTPYE